MVIKELEKEFDKILSWQNKKFLIEANITLELKKQPVITFKYKTLDYDKKEILEFSCCPYEVKKDFDYLLRELAYKNKGKKKRKYYKTNYKYYIKEDDNLVYVKIVKNN